MVLLAFLAAGSAAGPARRPRSRNGQIPFLNCLTGPIATIGEFSPVGRRARGQRDQRGRRHQGQAGEGHGRGHGLRSPEGLGGDGAIVKDTLVALGPVPEPVIMAAMPIAVENEMMSMTATTSYEYARSSSPGRSPGSRRPRRASATWWRPGASCTPT